MSVFKQFSINGVDYYFQNNKYYRDNMTTRVVITEREYRDALTNYFISK